MWLVQVMELVNVSIQYCSLTKYFDGLLDSLEHVFSRKDCKLLVHSKRVFKFYYYVFHITNVVIIVWSHLACVQPALLPLTNQRERRL